MPSEVTTDRLHADRMRDAFGNAMQFRVAGADTDRCLGGAPMVDAMAAKHNGASAS